MSPRIVAWNHLFDVRNRLFDAFLKANVFTLQTHHAVYKQLHFVSNLQIVQS